MLHPRIMNYQARTRASRMARLADPNQGFGVFPSDPGGADAGWVVGTCGGDLALALSRIATRASGGSMATSGRELAEMRAAASETIVPDTLTKIISRAKPRIPGLRVSSAMIEPITVIAIVIQWIISIPQGES